MTDRVTYLTDEQYKDLMEKLEKTQRTKKAKKVKSKEWKEVYATIEAQSGQDRESYMDEQDRESYS